MRFRMQQSMVLTPVCGLYWGWPKTRLVTDWMPAPKEASCRLNWSGVICSCMALRMSASVDASEKCTAPDFSEDLFVESGHPGRGF